MKSSFAAVLAIVAGASAASNVTYTTEVVTALTTYCPEATTFAHAGTTYTISEVRLEEQVHSGFEPEGRRDWDMWSQIILPTCPLYTLTYTSS